MQINQRVHRIGQHADFLPAAFHRETASGQIRLVGNITLRGIYLVEIHPVSLAYVPDLVRRGQDFQRFQWQGGPDTVEPGVAVDYLASQGFDSRQQGIIHVGAYIHLYLAIDFAHLAAQAGQLRHPWVSALCFQRIDQFRAQLFLGRCTCRLFLLHCLDLLNCRFLEFNSLRQGRTGSDQAA